VLQVLEHRKDLDCENGDSLVKMSFLFVGLAIVTDPSLSFEGRIPYFPPILIATFDVMFQKCSWYVVHNEALGQICKTLCILRSLYLAFSSCSF